MDLMPPRAPSPSAAVGVDRQVRMFGSARQALLPRFFGDKVDPATGRVSALLERYFDFQLSRTAA